MNLKQLEAFRTVMEVGTITRAGEVLHISQPAVSRLIGNLEHNIGYLLFDRRRGRLTPSAEGKALYQEVRKAFIGVSQIAETAKAIGNLETGRLSILAIPVLGHNLLPRAISKFRYEYPGISVSLEVIQSSATVVEWIASQRYDLGMTVQPIDDPNVRIQTFSQREARCVLPEGHSLQDKEELHASDLEGMDFISLQEGTLFRFRVDEIFNTLGISRNLVIQASTRHAVCELVAEGNGVAIVGPLFNSDRQDQRLVYKPFRPVITQAHSLIFPTFTPTSLATQRFVDIVSEMFDQEFNPAS